jgi:quercetin dioxygenase-like cupin family protein
MEDPMPFFDIAGRPAREIFPGVSIRTLYGESLMMSFVDFIRAGAEVPTHSHPHEQMGMGLAGEFELVIGDERQVVRPGDTYLIPSNVPHRARSLDSPARALDIFHPVRDDYR